MLILLRNIINTLLSLMCCKRNPKTAKKLIVMEFVRTDTVPFRGLLELINMHKPELLKIVDVETLYSLDILQGKPCVIDGNFEFLSFNLNSELQTSYLLPSF